MRLNEKHTISACFIGIVVQSIVINFPPLLFITFEREFGISLGKISLLIAISFIAQLIMDLLASKLPRLFDSRAVAVLGQVLPAAGFALLAFLPYVIDPFAGLVISIVIAAFGSGIIEVVGNPIIDSCTVKNKHRVMSALHSFYCWGLVLTVVLSTLFFQFFGTHNWRVLACLWAIVPALNAVYFALVPLNKLTPNAQGSHGARPSFRTLAFFSLIVMMICGGAAEQAMSQWASSFAEMGLGVSKTLGDILGPCSFALLMGLARVIYAKYSDRIKLTRFMTLSALLCVASYVLAALSPFPALSLVCCAICGFSVGIMWPGTLCLATGVMPNGGIKMFALLALAGDIGCTLGPTAAGWVAEAFGDDLRISFLLSALFPLVMLLFIAILVVQKRRHKKSV